MNSKIQIKDGQICVVIHHTEEVKVEDLYMVLNFPGKIADDESLLAILNKFLDVLWEHGYDFDLIGGDDDD